MTLATPGGRKEKLIYGYSMALLLVMLL